jgi:hypothetical protein
VQHGALFSRETLSWTVFSKTRALEAEIHTRANREERGGNKVRVGLGVGVKIGGNRVLETGDRADVDAAARTLGPAYKRNGSTTNVKSGATFTPTLVLEAISTSRPVRTSNPSGPNESKSLTVNCAVACKALPLPLEKLYPRPPPTENPMAEAPDEKPTKTMSAMIHFFMGSSGASVTFENLSSPSDSVSDGVRKLRPGRCSSFRFCITSSKAKRNARVTASSSSIAPQTISSFPGKKTVPDDLLETQDFIEREDKSCTIGLNAKRIAARLGLKFNLAQEHHLEPVPDDQEGTYQWNDPGFRITTLASRKN